MGYIHAHACVSTTIYTSTTAPQHQHVHTRTSPFHHTHAQAHMHKHTKHTHPQPPRTSALVFFSTAYTLSSRPARAAAAIEALTRGPLPAPTTMSTVTRVAASASGTRSHNALWGCVLYGRRGCVVWEEGERAPFPQLHLLPSPPLNLFPPPPPSPPLDIPIHGLFIGSILGSIPLKRFIRGTL